MASKFFVVGVALLDLLAFILAIVAEQRRSKATVQQDPNNGDLYCSYDADVSTSYGIVALVFLLLSQAIIMVLSRCFCCGRPLPPGKHRAWSGICFIACWITFVIAEICLLAASVRNARHTKYFVQDGQLSCETLRKGVFAAAAAFIFFTAILSELHYLLYSKAKDNFPGSSQGHSIGMTSF
ncbi:fiber (DUF1218) [Rhynchospora pubera]|uniref:Fiber (DUF1218) n=1 Tax=Rhynchospora pubera TaxID=906938 RepID=A0AAV8GTG1_9POAL|nr:fiber (DUF1218) [Rhynchospora pubera]KAJ4806148.1 fiber (DUF1218) [Rhynchospora pubera]